MPSRKGKEQALVWLKSKMAEKDTLDAINAEICYNVILDLENRRKAIGAMYHLSSAAKKRALEELEEEKCRKESVEDLYRSAINATNRYSERMRGDENYTVIDMTDAELEEIFREGGGPS